ncbi:MAG: hormogonium polysaccharide secretion pseudopilin HpsC [Coleofasciculus sp. A1-SPW-01]|uniref:hormogonium polysaccharide secretion pseudopilin HpsC n=1 Tax=Coleofasciculus sp. A1-SPW-01 TaxID=3070819 RepID=UPI0032F9FC4E
MINTLKFILLNSIKRSQRVRQVSGFTLIELLVAMIMAALVITPLLGFAINILQADRREQAKTTSQQEIQAALDYIARDLEQAVYIYDANGVERVNSSTATSSGIQDQIPPGVSITGCDSSTTTCKPVLVFWKRKFLSSSDTFNNGGTSITVGSLTNNNDTFVYSLVGYYLIEDNSSGTWSNTARIGRFEIRDGIRRAPQSDGSCPTGTSSRTEGTETVCYALLPSSGFMPFNMQLSGDLSTRMNQWTKHSDSFPNNMTVLIDYVDQSTTGITPTCAGSQQQVPATPVGGFYACVDSDRTIAEVFIRGNALARIRGGSSPPDYSSQESAFFPTGKIRVQGRGLLGVEN